MIGPAACERCLQLQLVDLSSTEVTEIMGSAFAHCKHLQYLRLPHKLRRIEQEAFLKCTSLTEVSVPPTLQDVPSLAARNSVNFKELENAGPGEEHTPEPMRFSSAIIWICQDKTLLRYVWVVCEGPQCEATGHVNTALGENTRVPDPAAVCCSADVGHGDQGLTVGMMWQLEEDHCTCDRNFQNSQKQGAV